MRTGVARPDTAAILRGLKDFQRDTVEYVFSRLYGPAATPRVLVADEVGLGKTLVARGVIAKAIDHLWDKKDRIDVVYICSNADIARQNVNRLNVTEAQEFVRTERITLLPTRIQDLQRNPLNFISLTPGTSFDLKSSLGHVQERVLLYRLLQKPWEFSGVAPRKVFQGNCTPENFISLLDRSDGSGGPVIDAGLAEQFLKSLDHHMAAERAKDHLTLRERFNELCDLFRHVKDEAPAGAREKRARWIGEVRTLLAASCLRALKPDLIVLDEFQRFRDLLTDNSELGQLASDLFEYDDVRVLLLSATPYKMYTLAAEAHDDNHYADFLRTLTFLEPSEARGFEGVLDDFRRELFRIGRGSLDRLLALKHDLERRLRKTIVRTERLAVTHNRDGMLKEMPRTGLTLTARDVATYPQLRRVADALDAGEVLEFWKSAPFLLNFMENYEVKRAFRDALEVTAREETLAGILSETPDLLLSWKDVSAYQAVDPGHAGLRKLAAETVGAGAWELLWVPPSLPYYQPAGAFAGERAGRFTKRLVFSAWHVVPKTITCLLSYEAEREMMRSFETDPKNTPDERKRRRPLLRFARSDERLTGLPVLGMVYPSLTLAAVGDPLALALSAEPFEHPLTLEAVRKRVAEHLRPLVSALATSSDTGAEDEAWYWAAPILLDLVRHEDSTRAWFRDNELADSWAGEQNDGATDGDVEESLWHAHVAHARELVAGKVVLGPQPSDLVDVLAELALAGPAVSALRALARVSGELPDPSRPLLRHEAGWVGHALLRLFNLPEVTAMIRGRNGAEPYWRRAIEYSLDGCIQAVLDEYAHVQRDLQGKTGGSSARISEEVAAGMHAALSLRTSALGVDDVRASKRGTVRVENRTMRGRFAVRFGEERSEDSERGANRAEQVRASFNSPFWPFVLATTSVGQEGLDFHPYCHAVVHWNLPANPVDLEQREGRVHRYKGHAVRKNLAAKFGLAALTTSDDPWDALFAAGVAERKPETSDLVPYWVYPLEGGASVERHLITFPLSRDAERMEALRRTLAVYRMVFGQSRQEDLVSYLLTQLPPDEIAEVATKFRIDLSPTVINRKRDC
ncbi:ATP-dependent helicase HepA [Gemmata obscuriglobus]|nr:helicase-related protein [Gemmata obscuriglobus]QEG27767.1 ATP-dependent helicase HepA [Gemmata obscuriglobus]VTS05060.1 DEAD/DEAH box helicase:helicase, C-terminal OS=Desulfobacterium autotrophicum (strain ATCC 43914 / DSM 3382 / HRM2) GN=HRM2_44520 PE=4 SV=1: Helicase_C [Gemmata obscuriglobus UQM 2246]